jgi:hypothetical protein
MLAASCINREGLPMRSAASLLAALLLAPAWAAVADTDACNQLGREVALRAAEQLPAAGLDAAARAELAAIAEAVCVDYTQPLADSAAAAGAAAARGAAETAEEGRRNILGLDIIPPEERVRRAALKRR